MKGINFGAKLLDDRWKATDQLIQLKGVVEFDERYKYWIGLKDDLQKKEDDLEYRKLLKSTHQLRELIKKYKASANTAIDDVIKKDKEMYRVARGLPPEEIIENQKQMVYLKKLAVDKTLYEVKKREKELYDAESKVGSMKDKIKQEDQVVRNKESEETERYRTALEYSRTHKDICRIALDTYEKLLGILKKDSYYFDDILDTLKEDSLVQSSAIIRMMSLGQMLSEDYSWLKKKSKRSAITFNNATREARTEIKRISNQIKQLDLVNDKLKEYATYGYTLYQDEKKEPAKLEKEVQLYTALQDLNDFNDVWKKCLNVEERDNFFPRLVKVYRINTEINNRADHIHMLKDYYQTTSSQLETVLEEFQNSFDDEVRKYLDDIFDIQGELTSIANNMQEMKKQEDIIKKEIEVYKNYIYQFKRMLADVHIGPAFGDVEESDLKETVREQIDSINKLRYENPPLHLASDDEDGKRSEEGDIEACARAYLDPNMTFDIKTASIGEPIAKEKNPIILFDNVLMQMKTLQEVLGTEISREPTEEELMALGDFYSQVQMHVDQTVDELMEMEKISYKTYKPRTDSYHKKSCLNKSRTEVKIDNQKIVFENEGPTQGVVVSKGALHPPGVVRGMYVPDTDAEDEEEEEGAKEDAAHGKAEEDDDNQLLQPDDVQSSSSEATLYSELDPDQPKPHICF